MKEKLPDRYWIVLLALVINMVCYTDRACIAVAGPEIRKAFHFTQAQMGLVYSIFSLSYFLGQTPWGALADRKGSRGIVAFAVAGWSAFTALTGTAWNFLSMLMIRFTFGALESAFSPSIAAAFNRWVPVGEQATAFGFFLGGGRLGAAMTPPIVAFLMVRYGWRLPFLVFGAVGFVSSVVWFKSYSDNLPVDGIRNLEANRSRAKARINWSSLLRSSRLWCLLAAAFGATFMWQFYMTWFPTYLREHRGLSVAESSFYASIPFLAGVGATWLGGMLTDLIGRQTNVRFARTVIGLVSLCGGALLMSVGLWLPQAGPAALSMGLAAGALDLYLGAAWASAIDIGGGTAAGLVNASSNCAAFVSPALMGWVLQRFNNWDWLLLLSVVTTCAAAVSWLFVNPRVAQPAIQDLAKAV
jgi:MFS family permease